MSGRDATQQMITAMQDEIDFLGAQIVLGNTIAETAKQRRRELKERIAQMSLVAEGAAN